MKGKVLVTRPIEDAEEFAAQIIQKNYDVVCEPFLEVVIHDVELNNLEDYQGLIFTSKNGVRAYCHNTQNRSLPVWTVGDATRNLAISMGFKNVHSAKGNVLALEKILPKIPLLYVRGEDVTKELNNDHITAKILYHTEIIEKISDEISSVLKKGSFTYVVFFSTRTCEAFVNIIKKNGLEQGLIDSKALCLGPSMVESLSVLPWKAIKVAERPNRESVIQLLK